MPEYRVLRIDEQLYGCEELPAGQPVLCDVTLTDAAGAARILPLPGQGADMSWHRRGRHRLSAAGRHPAQAVRSNFMHNIYFTRHGETVWNVENKICGMTDSPATARGQEQARQLGEAVRDSGRTSTRSCTLPVPRRRHRQMAIAEATGLPARCEPRLREQCFGKYEGTPRDGCEFRISKTHFADRYDGGESMMQLAQRIYNLLDELKADTGKTYSHTPSMPHRAGSRSSAASWNSRVRRKRDESTRHAIPSAVKKEEAYTLKPMMRKLSAYSRKARLVSASSWAS